MIEFATELTDLDGKVMQTFEPDGGKLLEILREIASGSTDGRELAQSVMDAAAPITPVTLRSISVHVLGLQFKDEANLDGNEKMKRGLLAQRIHQAAEPTDLAAEDKTLLKRLIAKAYGPMVVLRAWALIDPACLPAAKGDRS